jgi:AcrR family transcriptional regulator
MSDLPESQASPARRRRRRIPATEVRDQMLATARSMITTSGVTISMEELSLEEVIRRADVPRSSAYRIWPYRDDFIDDLILHMAGPDWFGAGAFDQPTLDLAAQVVIDHGDMLQTPDGRRTLLLEAIRQAIKLNLESLIGSDEWRIFLALAATARSTPDPKTRARVEGMLGETEKRFVSTMSGFYQSMAEVLGLRLRFPDHHRFEHIAVAGAALLEGLALRHLLAQGLLGSGEDEGGDPYLRDIIHTPLPGPAISGDMADWSLAAVAFLGIAEAFVEPDPDHQPSLNAAASGTTSTA